MSTSLNDSSGDGFFGKGYWGNKVFWRNVPYKWRELDVYNFLQMLLNTWGDAGEDLLEQIRCLPEQRDPYLVRAKETDTRWFYVTEVFLYEDEEKGEVVRLVGEKNFNDMPGTSIDNPPSDDEDILSEYFPWFPYEPLKDVGKNWELFWGDASYKVVNTRLRNYDPPDIYNSTSSLANEIWVNGGDLTLLFDYYTNRNWDIDESSNPIQGTVNIGITDGSQRPVVTLPITPVRLERNIDYPGIISMLTESSRLIVRVPVDSGGYKYLYDVPTLGDSNTGILSEGSLGIISGVECGTVNYLSGKITIDLSLLGEFSDTRGQAIKAKYSVLGYFMKFNRPSMLDHLARDYGFDNDKNDPEEVQRSTIANITNFWGIKATEDCYRIRGGISLFDVDVQGLYRLYPLSMANQVPSDHVYEIGDNVYTDIAPVFLRFDHIAADEQFFDYQYVPPPGSPSSVWVTLIDNMLISEDSSRWDGMSIGQAYAVDVTQGYWGNISAFNSTVRGPAQIISVTQLTQAELDDNNWQNGYYYEISMRRCQHDAFNFHYGLFALSIYDFNPAGVQWGTPPSLDDVFYYIDQDISWSVSDVELDSKEDMGTWTVAIQFGDGVLSPLSVDDDIAVRYIPQSLSLNCNYCRSNNMRASVTATSDAYEYYDTYSKVDLAISRLKNKLLYLKPIHTNVIEWEVTRNLYDSMYGVQNSTIVEHELDGDVFYGNYSVELTVEIRGDINTAGKAIELEIESEDTGIIWSDTLQTSASDNETWEEVVTDEVVIFPDDLSPDGDSWRVWLGATASSYSIYGDVRWIFKIVKRET